MGPAAGQVWGGVCAGVGCRGLLAVGLPRLRPAVIVTRLCGLSWQEAWLVRLAVISPAGRSILSSQHQQLVRMHLVAERV